ncbi:helix-turn-helix domain-containing protein [Paenibacillus sp. PL91]|uniref:helix-turn-helix domain-containing protein n=1 Tax=Paenibacillus sp. PL91 TaxID=2729538 RepID=UPI00145E4961|nr:helix-turn-helix domain-containing protein [Paenibacillus sp. PL91]MBC9199759.1 helix-turn-helix domain-containing protein [Paenibacillus sp. PL91]
MEKRKKKRGNYPKRVPPLGELHYIAIELMALRVGQNYEDTAKELGISVRTLYRWRQRPDFYNALIRATRRRFNVMYPIDNSINAVVADPKHLTQVLGLVGLLP